MDRRRDNDGDVVLYVCGHAFVGSRGALAAASPYLGSVLAAASVSPIASGCSPSLARTRRW